MKEDATVIGHMVGVLQRWHVGEDRGIGGHELAQQLGLSGDRALRELLEVVQEEYPIVSTSSAGIYWCGCREDFDPALRQSKSNLFAYARRHRRMVKTRDRLYPEPQLKLF
jgi:hypothetical protein